MDLQQIHASYHQEEDRLLFRVSYLDATGELHEIRAWITRQLLKTLWAGLVTAMEAQVALDQPQAAHAKAEIAGMQHEASLMDLQARGGFDQAFKADINKFPFGEHPILLTQAHIKVDSGQGPRIQFVSTAQRHFELGFTPVTFHALCKVLRDAVVNVDWGIELRLPKTNAPSETEKRLLN
jgi:hypothetical protein